MKTLLAALVLVIAFPAGARPLDDAEVPAPANGAAAPPLGPTVPPSVPVPPLLRDVPSPIVAPASPMSRWSADKPRSYKLVRNTAFIGIGVALLGASWGAPALAGAFTREPELAIPVGGPFVYAMQFRNDRSWFGSVVTLCTFEALGQLGGMSLILIGALTKHRVWTPPVNIVPLASRDRVGAALSVRF